MSASFGNQGNWGGASSMGGGGNMSQQEHRGTGGILGMMGEDSWDQFPMMGGGTTGGMYQAQMKEREQARLRAMLKEMGIDIDGLGGGGIGSGAGQQPPTQAANWSFPQYTQSWLPPAPAVPPMYPTPAFKK